MERRCCCMYLVRLVLLVFLRLVELDRMTLNSRTHFFAVSARLMRHILVDHARRARADKRGGGATVIGLGDVSPAAPPTSGVDVLALDEALEVLSSFDARQCRVVELRFFAGLNIPEAADALGISTATVSVSGPWRRPGSIADCRLPGELGE